MLRTVYVETSYHFGNMFTTLFGVLFEKQSFQFLYEFFYGVLEVGLNTRYNSPAHHCFAIENSISKF